MLNLIFWNNEKTDFITYDFDCSPGDRDSKGQKRVFAIRK